MVKACSGYNQLSHKYRHTLINPPSGFALRYLGCAFTKEERSLELVTIRNFAGGGFEYTISGIIDPGSRFIAKVACLGEKFVGEMFGLDDIALIGK